MKARRARLINEAESRKEEASQGTSATKKMKAVPEEAIASNLDSVSANWLKMDYGLVAQTALHNSQQDLCKKFEQLVRSELEKLDILQKTAKREEREVPKIGGLRINVILENIFGMTREGS